MPMTEHDRQNLPTQSLKPWRAVFRTLIVAGLAMIPVLQSVAVDLGIDSVPWIAGTLALMVAIQRVLSIPAVEIFLQRYAPWLAAAGAYVGKHRGAENAHTPTPTTDGGK